MFTKALPVAFMAAGALAHGSHDSQVPFQGPHKALWYNTLPGDGGTQVSQLTSLLPSWPQLTLVRPIPSSRASRPSVVSPISHASPQTSLSMILLSSVGPLWIYRYTSTTHPGNSANARVAGAPFDTGTSYRPGARFGPSGIRQGSRRLNL